MKMKNNIKLLLMTVLAGCVANNSFAGNIRNTILQGRTGTTSATTVVAAEAGSCKLTDIMTRVDTGVSTASVVFRQGVTQHRVTSSTTANGTALFFNNVNSQGTLAVQKTDYVIFQPIGSNVGIVPSAQSPYVLLRCNNATSTSITVQETITTSTTISTTSPTQTDVIWSTLGSFSKPVPNGTLSPTSGSLQNVWLPADVPTALTLDGNTTACSLFISGIRIDAE